MSKKIIFLKNLYFIDAECFDFIVLVDMWSVLYQKHVIFPNSSSNSKVKQFGEIPMASPETCHFPKTQNHFRQCWWSRYARKFTAEYTGVTRKSFSKVYGVLGRKPLILLIFAFWHVDFFFCVKIYFLLIVF